MTEALQTVAAVGPVSAAALPPETQDGLLAAFRGLRRN
jgi:hypothetical protein